MRLDGPGRSIVTGPRLTAFLASRVLPTEIALRIAERMFRSKA